MEIPVLVRSLKSSILSSTSFQMGKTFWWVVSAAVEKSRCKANMVAQGDGKFGPWGWPQDPSILNIFIYICIIILYVYIYIYILIYIIYYIYIYNADLILWIVLSGGENWNTFDVIGKSGYRKWESGSFFDLERSLMLICWDNKWNDKQQLLPV